MAAPEVVSEDLRAEVALALAGDFASWVRRRVETISYIADTAIRRQMSIDLVLPCATREPFAQVPLGAVIWVPLWLPRKMPMTHFDVWDETGRTLPVLNTRENGSLASLGLRLLVEGNGHELTQPQRAAITEIATSKEDDARERLEASKAWLDEVLPRGSGARSLLSDLAGAFMLLVPLKYEPDIHRVIKWSTDRRLGWYREHPENAKLANRIVTSLALRDKVQLFKDLAVGLSESYHVEIVAPDDVVISDAAMVAEQWPGGKISEVLSTAEQRERAHVYVTMAASRDETEAARGDRATVYFTLRARRTAAFVGLFVTSSLIALMLAFVRWRVHSLDSTNATALLLAFPALVAAYLARPGEHVLAARLLTGVRALGLVAAVCSVAAAAMIAGGLLQSRMATRIDVPKSSRCKPEIVSTPTAIDCPGAYRKTVLLGPRSGWLALLEALFGLSLLCACLLLLGLRAPKALDAQREERRDRLIKAGALP